MKFWIEPADVPRARRCNGIMQQSSGLQEIQVRAETEPEIAQSIFSFASRCRLWAVSLVQNLFEPLRLTSPFVPLFPHQGLDGALL